ncbi:glycosyltransferase [Parasedimentitalea marina]|uniref:glycosyltransferase n=1 Tax=Parasedimentitalea marina TaxID=2483033 RepID=UPI00237A6B98|nr:glycosyltransferase [Parasedimentitalea marina]
MSYRDLQKQVETHPFTTYARYLETLALADCAIMPLANDIFNSCKSAVRVIDAASVGVPSIAGTVSDMAHVIRAGETGLIADEPEAWTTAFEQLARDPDTARKMGNAARADLETRWSGQPEDHIISPKFYTGSRDERHAHPARQCLLCPFHLWRRNHCS